MHKKLKKNINSVLIEFVTHSSYDEKDVNAMFYEAPKFPLLNKRLISTRVKFFESWEWAMPLLDIFEEKYGPTVIQKNVENNNFNYEFVVKETHFRYYNESRILTVVLGIATFLAHRNKDKN